MTISEVCDKYDLTADTLRYYEKYGLIEPVAKISGKRDYSDHDLERVEFIQCMKRAGLSLGKLKRFLDIGDQSSSAINERISILVEQRQNLVNELASKQRSLDFLDYKINLYQYKQDKLNKEES
ncbi:MAG: MerR family transcriptional regulator [Candidatus Saccharibacteria bacterium]|nr:MerR family transcriptional regulator [Candidatus Saccharibacteria bacterium]